MREARRVGGVSLTCEPLCRGLFLRLSFCLFFLCCYTATRWQHFPVSGLLGVGQFAGLLLQTSGNESAFSRSWRSTLFVL